MENIKILTLEDLENEKYKIYINEINKKNRLMSSFLTKELEKNSSNGIREDVLQFISDNIDSICNKDSNLNYEFFIANMSADVSVSPEWYSWFDEYFEDENHIDIEDFSYLFNEFYTERHIPLEDIKELFKRGQNDVLTIQNLIIAYVPDPEDERQEPVEVSTNNDYNGSSVDSASDVEIEDSHKNEFGYVELFDNLLAVMSYRGSEEQSITGVQNEMNKILAKFQLATTEMSTYAVEIFKAWEKDKDEIKKLKSLYNMQQNLLANQQRKINEQKADIIKLRNRINESEKADIQRESLNHKLLEIQGLMSEMNNTKSEDYDF